MAVVDDNVWPPGFVSDDVQPVEVAAVDFAPVDWAPEVAVAEHAEFGEGEGDGFGEEDFADCGGDGGEGVADAADYYVLEGGGGADEGGFLGVGGEVAFAEELVWHLDDWGESQTGCEEGCFCCAYEGRVGL